MHRSLNLWIKNKISIIFKQNRVEEIKQKYKTKNEKLKNEIVYLNEQLEEFRIENYKLITDHEAELETLNQKFKNKSNISENDAILLKQDKDKLQELFDRINAMIDDLFNKYDRKY